MNTKLIFLLLLALFSFAASQETNLETGELETSALETGELETSFIENEETPILTEQENQETETISPEEVIPEELSNEEFTGEFIENEEDNEEIPVVIPVEEDEEPVEEEPEVEFENDGIFVEIPNEALAPTLPELGEDEEEGALSGESLDMYLSTIVLSIGLVIV